MNPADDLLFVGFGNTAVCWYRCVLPGVKLGCDYVGVFGDPPDLTYVTGIVQGKSELPNWLDYKVVVLQQPMGPPWLEFIRALQAAGIKVVFEVDDWLHAIKSQKDHDFREAFNRDALAAYEMCMKACDAMIVSTEFLARTYRSFNKRIYVCENGVDVARYNLRLPARDPLYIGWAGATGHRDAAVPWLQVVARVMKDRPNVNFVSIGQPFAKGFHAHFPEERAIAIPFTAIEQYPAAMTTMDIALGPAAPTGFYRGKSDLRWLEAGALGIPIVADPLVYPKIKDGVTGVHATPKTLFEKLIELVDDPGLRLTIGDNARRYVHAERSAEITSKQWAEVALDLLGES